ncbi:MAG: NYN domain-containing protein [Polyangiaceae bacterium]
MTILNYTYVDNSNVFIEGQRVSAVRRGMAIDIYDAHDRGIFDFTWQLDYGVLHDIVCGQKSEIGAAKLWGSPPPGDTFWKMIETKGFKVKTYDKSPKGKEKKVDVAIAHEITKDAYTVLAGKQSAVEITLAAGDKDFCPVVEDLRAQGFRVVVAFWGHAAKELRELASDFFCLDPHLNVLTHTR